MGIFVGIDWAEQHDDGAVVDARGPVLAPLQSSRDVDGLTRLSKTVAGLSRRRGWVQVTLETDRGLLVPALVAAGYHVSAIDPKSVDRYRDRYAV
jgi:transposase